MAISTIGGVAAGATDEGATLVKSYTLSNGNAKIVGPFTAGVYAIEAIHGLTSNDPISLYSYVGTTPTLLTTIPNNATTTSGIFAGKTTRLFTLTSTVDGFAVPSDFLPVTLVIKKFASASVGGFTYTPNLASPNFTTVNIGTSGYSMSFACSGNYMAFGSYSGANVISNDDGASWGNVLNGDYTVAMTDTVTVYVQNNSNTYYTYPKNSFSATQRSFGPYNPNPYGGNRMAYGNGVLVMFGTGANSVMTTNTDAASWTYTNGLAFTADAVCFDGTKFVATSGTSTYSSTNGISWTLVSTTRPSGFSDIYFGNGMYLVTGSAAVYYTSTDLVSWTSRTNPFGNTNMDWAVYRNGAWAMGRYGTTSVGSYDGINWVTLSGSPGGTYQGGLNNSGRYYIWGWSASNIAYNQNRTGVIA